MTAVSRFALFAALLAPAAFAADEAAETAKVATASAPEVFSARVFRPGGSVRAMSTITLAVDRWTTMAERQALLDVFQKDGMKGLSEALRGVNLGHAKEAAENSSRLVYALSIETQQGRLVRLLAERPMVLGEFSRTTRVDYSAFGYAEFTEIDGETGKGTGTIVPMAQPDLQKDGHFRILSLGAKPYKITEVTVRK